MVYCILISCHLQEAVAGSRPELDSACYNTTGTAFWFMNHCRAATLPHGDTSSHSQLWSAHYTPQQCSRKEDGYVRAIFILSVLE